MNALDVSPEKSLAAVVDVLVRSVEAAGALVIFLAVSSAAGSGSFSSFGGRRARVPRPGRAANVFY